MKLYFFCRAVVSFFVGLFTPWKIYGKENMPKDACVICGNHYCIWDVLFVAYASKKDMIHYMAKKELTENKFLNGCMKRFEAIPVDRQGADAKAIMQALRYLKKGEKVCIFPEGTRNKIGVDLLPLKPGAVMLAHTAKAPIVPIMAEGKLRPFHRTKVIVGKPIYFEEYEGKKLTKEDIEQAEEKLRRVMLSTREEFFAEIERKKQEKIEKKLSKKNKKA